MTLPSLNHCAVRINLPDDPVGGLDGDAAYIGLEHGGSSVLPHLGAGDDHLENLHIKGGNHGGQRLSGTLVTW